MKTGKLKLICVLLMMACVLMMMGKLRMTCVLSMIGIIGDDIPTDDGDF